MNINSLLPIIFSWLEEDDLTRNYFYLQSLPKKEVFLKIKIKSDLIFAGADFFIAVFKSLGIEETVFADLKNYEGKLFTKGEVISFDKAIPFSVAVTGERLALNLIQHASSIATHTNKFVQQSALKNIKILDTRKTTPGLRLIEKYAVRVGGGFNHRFGQTDTWMVKDNHKTCLGGLKGAVDFFKSQGVFYNNIVAEIHTLDELQEAKGLQIKHIMLDNFSPDDIPQAVLLKEPGMTFEVSGGIALDTLSSYLVDGVDAISSSSLTSSAPRVDISLKYKP